MRRLRNVAAPSAAMMSAPIKDIASLTPSCTTNTGAGTSSAVIHSVRAGLLGAMTALLHPAVHADPAPTQPSEIDAWGQAVCNNWRGPDYPAVLTRSSPGLVGLPSATTEGFACDNYYPAELVGNKGCSYDLEMDIAGYLSADSLNTDIGGLANKGWPVLAYATKKDAVNVWWIVVASACVGWQDLPAIVPARALQTLQALQRFGFTVKPWRG